MDGYADLLARQYNVMAVVLVALRRTQWVVEVQGLETNRGGFHKSHSYILERNNYEMQEADSWETWGGDVYVNFDKDMEQVHRLV